MAEVEFGGEYKRTACGDPSTYSRRRQLLYEISRFFQVELDAVIDERPRVSNQDLAKIVKQMIREFDYQTDVVLFQDLHDKEDLERVSSDGGESP
ncbi:hypothetical protein SAMN05443574_12426 [Haloarcula vallismortis]|uniref:Uncharacterized protein n=2 Tax=Haloarcula vallismortis TaxID=28442 RepID=M0JLC4_HALVA|nr:hypothetical protein [Haloarcula vallismortis]EMA09942.1 hypothetical protein C437_04775 [Haloarcula vallismortis ATCC 29715]SDX28113.1 hypothetical protein SAMN05443574_12426 [Haloarcula vallismortis]